MEMVGLATVTAIKLSDITLALNRRLFYIEGAVTIFVGFLTMCV